MKSSFNLKRSIWVIAGLLPAITFIFFFPDYLVKHTFFWVCLLTLPISIIKDKSHRFPYYGLSLVLAGLTLLLPTTIGVYVFICALVLYLGQQYMGGLHAIALVHIFLASPFFTYLSSLVSFPIRLQLSKAVSSMLSLSGIENTANGNIIELGSHSFLVDQACSGIYLLGYGLLFGTILLAFRIRTKTIRWHILIFYYLLLIGFIIWGNLVRIYFLVVFNIESSHWLHDGLGLVVYILQILVPFYLILRFKTKKVDDNIRGPEFNPIFPRSKYAFLLVLLVGMFIGVEQKKNIEISQHPMISLTGFSSTIVNQQVTKISNDQTLIYIKNPVAPYSADHNPMICWSGSGYEFQKIEKTTVGNHEVNISNLKNDTDTLYTAWWFESEESQTGSQWDWRMRALKNGERFYLVNVTCGSKKELLQQIEILNQTHLIRPSQASLARSE